MCPSITFGIAIIELALAQLLSHFDWKLPNEVKPEELDMTENFGSTCRRKNDMYLNVTPPIPFFMETCTMVTPGILSRVFLFYFEKISSRSDLFQVFRKIPAEIQDLASMKFVLKKKKRFLKSKQICILYTEKSQNGKKKNENKRNEQSYLYNKL